MLRFICQYYSTSLYIMMSNCMTDNQIDWYKPFNKRLTLDIACEKHNFDAWSNVIVRDAHAFEQDIIMFRTDGIGDRRGCAHVSVITAPLHITHVRLISEKLRNRFSLFYNRFFWPYCIFGKLLLWIWSLCVPEMITKCCNVSKLLSQ